MGVVFRETENNILLTHNTNGHELIIHDSFTGISMHFTRDWLAGNERETKRERERERERRREEVGENQVRLYFLILFFIVIISMFEKLFFFH